MASNQPVLLVLDGSEGAKEAIDHAASLFPNRPLLVLSVGTSLAAAASAGAIGLPTEVAGQAVIRLDAEVQALG